MPGVELVAQWTAANYPISALEFVRTESGHNALVVAAALGRPGVWDPETGRALAPASLGVDTTEGGGSASVDLVFVPRLGTWPRLAAVTTNAITLYDMATGAAVSSVATAGRLHFVDSLQRGDGSSIVVAGGRGETVYLWDATPAGGLTALATREPPVLLNVLRRERWLAVVHGRGITAWDFNPAEPVEFLQLRAEGVRSTAFFHDAFGQPRLAAVSPRGIEIWDLATGHALNRFAKRFTVAAIAAVTGEDGESLLAAASDRSLLLWSPAAGSYEPLTEDLPGPVKALAKIIAGDGTTLLAAGDARGIVTVWRLPPVVSTAASEHRQRGWINAVVAGDDAAGAAVLASVSDDGGAEVWKLSDGVTWTLPVVLDGRRIRFHAVAFVGNEVLATAGDAGQVGLWSLASESMLAQWRAGTGAIWALAAFHEAGDAAGAWCLAAAGVGGVVTIWRLRRDGQGLAESEPWRVLRAAPVGGAPVELLIRDLAVFTDGGGRTMLAVASSTGRVEVWDLATGERRWPDGVRHGAQVRAIAAISSSRSTVLASGGDDGQIRFWDEHGQPSAVIDAHTGPVAALAVVDAEPGRLLVSGGADRAIKVWDPATGALVGEIQFAHDSWVRTLAEVRSAGLPPRIASGGDDGAVRIWHRPDRHRLLQSTKNVSLRGFGDRPSQRDLLDREHIAEELRELLLEPPGYLGPEATTGPQVVTIEGPWGSGKTSVMHQLRGLLETPPPPPRPTRPLAPREVVRILRPGRPTTGGRARPATSAAVPGRVVTAWFNPWAHQSSEQVWAGLAWSIINAVNPALGTTTDRQRYWLTRNGERLDRAAVRRTLRQRIWLPTQAVAAAWLLPLSVALAYRGGLSSWTVVAAVSAVLVGLGVRSIWQYWRGDVTAYLPPDLFEGPVAPSVSAARAGTEPLIRDPLYDAAAGQLHRTQLDVYQLITDLQARGHQIVVFIDDLDRCTSQATAEVFEAVNGFLHGQYATAERSGRTDERSGDRAPTTPGARFVIGLYPSVVALRIAESHSEQVRGAALTPDGLDIGWAYLHKLSQLSVVLPSTPIHHTTRLLRYHTGPGGAGPVSAREDRAAGRVPPPPTRPARRRGRRHPPAPAPPEPVAAAALEAEPAVRERLLQLASLRHQSSVRETKRLITQWVYYMRLLHRQGLLSVNGIVQEACDVLVLAEVIRRWPFLVPEFGQVRDGESVLRSLVRVAVSTEDRPGSAKLWRQALAAAGLDHERYATATANLRILLIRYGSPRLGEFADALL